VGQGGVGPSPPPRKIWTKVAMNATRPWQRSASDCEGLIVCGVGYRGVGYVVSSARCARKNKRKDGGKK
jgi:hypothetical protein